MRALTITRLALAGAAVVAATALISCSTSTDGTATCPGCGSNAEPNFPTPRPSTKVALPPLAPSPAPGPAPTATAAPAPGAKTVPSKLLPANEQGYVYVETKSGNTRCELNSETVGCESQFENSPTVNGEPANGVSVSSGGNIHWISGNLGNIPVVTLDYQTYAAQGWTIAADPSGTRFTNDNTGHGMFVAVEGVQSF